MQSSALNPARQDILLAELQQAWGGIKTGTFKIFQMQITSFTRLVLSSVFQKDSDFSQMQFCELGN